MFKKFVCIVLLGIFFVVFPVFLCKNVNADILGITWEGGELVSFDPYEGLITMKHKVINENASFMGLTYNESTEELYALSQGNFSLYSVAPKTLEIEFVGSINIDRKASWGEDIGGITYNPSTNALYTTVNHWDPNYTNIWSELVTINLNTLETTSIGQMTNGFVNSITYDETSGLFNAYAVYGSGSWDSPYKSDFVTIDPGSAEMRTVFSTPYHTIMGLADNPSDDTFYSWINSTSHFYGEIDPTNEVINQLGNADPVGVISAMIYKGFFIAPEFDGLVTTTDTFISDHLTLGDTFSFDYWWGMGMDPTDGNLDILIFNDTEWESFGWELSFDENSDGWQTASFYVPEWARGQEAQIMFRVFDFGQETDPILYLNNISSNSAPVPGPSTIILLGGGLIGFVGTARKGKRLNKGV